MRLVPQDAHIKALSADYAAMQEMLFGEIPQFEAIMDEVRQLEERVNSLPYSV